MDYKRFKVTVTWVGGLLGLLVLGLVWLGVLVVAIFQAFTAHDRQEVYRTLGAYAFLLLIVGLVFRSQFNKFYDWCFHTRLQSILGDARPKGSLQERFDAVLEKYESQVSLELSETFKDQLRASPTFRATVQEAAKLVLEAVAFEGVPHSEEEREAFRKTWREKIEAFANRVAENDPLAVEVILKGIEKESERTRV
jgi:hypothetical protein